MERRAGLSEVVLQSFVPMVEANRSEAEWRKTYKDLFIDCNSLVGEIYPF